MSHNDDAGDSGTIIQNYDARYNFHTLNLLSVVREDIASQVNSQVSTEVASVFNDVKTSLKEMKEQMQETRVELKNIVGTLEEKMTARSNQLELRMNKIDDELLEGNVDRGTKFAATNNRFDQLTESIAKFVQNYLSISTHN